MRHGVFGQKLGRSTKTRKSLLHNLSSALLEKGKITTTVAKAKFARPYIEKLITKARRNSLHGQRTVSSLLSSKAFTRLTREIAPGFAARNGGYTKIIRLDNRQGDSAEMARLELLEWDKKLAKVTQAGKKREIAKIARSKKPATTKKHTEET
ncbi:50S ribosomal protein L17 [Candidatus Curtissbacteria bacterium RBG_13_40_7]|uniref:50S ribosomal protein L17 n=1 Tax=Candidatus Curtissbacteria bacterium RBG_13_40_7 TaxID=1797706 RepID=A0A1F5FX42_9BACT|nr:MAG: 50S ribosomal protein L17 [Candidatus Curtissbacteria bacterium RBG_13_40_7]